MKSVNTLFALGLTAAVALGGVANAESFNSKSPVVDFDTTSGVQTDVSRSVDPVLTGFNSRGPVIQVEADTTPSRADVSPSLAGFNDKRSVIGAKQVNSASEELSMAGFETQRPL